MHAALRVDNIESHMHDVWDQLHVAFPASAATVLAERLFKREFQEKMFEIVHGEGVGSISNSRALLQVSVVPGNKQLVHF